MIFGQRLGQNLQQLLNGPIQWGILPFHTTVKRIYLFKKFKSHIYSFVCVYVCACAWMVAHMEVKGQLTGLCFLQLSCGSWGLSSGYKVWRQVLSCSPQGIVQAGLELMNFLPLLLQRSLLACATTIGSAVYIYA